MPTFTPLFTPSYDEQSVLIGFSGDVLLLSPQGALPTPQEFQALGEPLHRFHIGKIETTFYTICVWDEACVIPSSLAKTNLRNFLNFHPPHIFAMLNRAKQLAHWLYDNRYCGRCGHRVSYAPKDSSLKCTHCDFTIFPRLSPASIVLISDQDKILLARSPHFTKGMYSLLAGFVEAGESVEECVHREIYEEVGLYVKNLRYFGSQPWPFPHSLMLGFRAEYHSGTLRLQVDEIENAQWFTKNNLPLLPSPRTISGMMIETWLKEH